MDDYLNNSQDKVINPGSTADITCATSQLVVIAEDPENQALSFSWTCTIGTFTTSTTNDTVAWQAPESTGSYICTVNVSDGINTVSGNITITVSEPPNDFFDNFSQGEGNWTFLYCTHSIINDELEMISTHSTAQSVAESFTFSPSFFSYRIKIFF